jgi:hypothetical protein
MATTFTLPPLPTVEARTAVSNLLLKMYKNRREILSMLEAEAIDGTPYAILFDLYVTRLGDVTMVYTGEGKFRTLDIMPFNLCGVMMTSELSARKHVASLQKDPTVKNPRFAHWRDVVKMRMADLEDTIEACETAQLVA